MAFAFTLDSTVPAEGGLVSAGAGNIRNLTAALIERLNSFFVDANTSPLTGKSGAQMSDTTFTGLITVSPAVKAIAINNAAGGSNSSLFFGYPNDGSHASYIDFNGLWRLGQGVNAASTNALTIRDTGTSTDVLRIDNSDRIFINGGGVTVSTGGLTVSAGTTAVQALTCTTLGPSGAITSSATGSLFVRSGASTAAQYVDLSNTTGRLLLGVESSAGGSLLVASTGYATVLTTVGATVLQLGTNQGLALTISAAQLVTIVSGLVITTGGLTVSAGDTLLAAGIRQTGTIGARFENTFVTRPASSTGVGLEVGVSGGVGLVQAYNATGAAYVPLLLQGSYVQIAQGPLLINTTTSAGALAGWIVITNSCSYSALSQAGVVVPLMTLSAGDRLTLNCNGSDLAFTNILVATTATAGAGRTIPATCDGFFRIQIGGTSRNVPFFAL